MYTDEQIDKFQFSEAYATWLCENGQDYCVYICNGDALLIAQEKLVGFSDFLDTQRE